MVIMSTGPAERRQCYDSDSSRWLMMWGNMVLIWMACLVSAVIRLMRLTHAVFLFITFSGKSHLCSAVWIWHRCWNFLLFLANISWLLNLRQTTTFAWILSLDFLFIYYLLFYFFKGWFSNIWIPISLNVWNNIRQPIKTFPVLLLWAQFCLFLF